MVALETDSPSSTRLELAISVKCLNRIKFCIMTSNPRSSSCCSFLDLVWKKNKVFIKNKSHFVKEYHHDYLDMDKRVTDWRLDIDPRDGIFDPRAVGFVPFVFPLTLQKLVSLGGSKATSFSGYVHVCRTQTNNWLWLLLNHCHIKLTMPTELSLSFSFSIPLCLIALPCNVELCTKKFSPQTCFFLA